METSVQLLVVEDERVVGELLAAALEDAGYSVQQADSGEEAVEILQRLGTDCRALITDIRLRRAEQRLTGWDVARQARELNPDIPIIYTSGDSGGDWTAQGVPKSIMIGKPYAMAQIIAAVSQLLNESG